MTLPDGPKLPALLQTLAIIARPTQFLEDCAFEHGDTFTLRVLGVNSPPVVFFSHPEAVQAIFTTLADRLELGQVTQVFRPLVGGQSLIMQQGAAHQRQRQLLMPAFHKDSLQQQGQLICDLTRQQVGQWTVGQRLDIRAQMSDISLQVILQVVFGLAPGERLNQLQALLARLLEKITDPQYSVQFFLPPLQRDLGPWSPWGQFLEQQRQIDGLIGAEIEERRAQSQTARTDILALLMAARDEAGNAMDDAELRDQLMTLLLLGHETTASSLAWAFYWLHQRPEILARLQAEIDSAGPDPIGLAEQPYLTAVCKEALRIYPIALISQPRKVKQAVQLEGYDLAPGTVLIPCIYLAQRRAATYGDPQTFRPDRFLDRKFSPYEFFPFGGGSRICVGMALSLFEMKLVLATVLGHCRLTAPTVPPRPVRRGITFVPPPEARLVVESLR
jgi:cytochrome P450 family 110